MRLIDADELEIRVDEFEKMTGMKLDIVHDFVSSAPSVHPERKTGKWIVWGGMDVPENHGRHKCSECGEFALLRYEKPLRKEVLSDFCPNCGARMEGEAYETD